MPKRAPDVIHSIRIELQDKEREFLEALQTTQSIKNVAYAGSAVVVAGIGYLGWKTLHEAYTGEEPSILNVLTKEGRANYQQRIRDDPEGTFWKAIFDPLGINPLI